MTRKLAIFLYLLCMKPFNGLFLIFKKITYKLFGAGIPPVIFNIGNGGDPKEVDTAISAFLKKSYSLRRKKSVSAVIRVKNASPYIELSVLSIAPLCEEIIIVDNVSTDGSSEIYEKIKEKLSGRCVVKIFSYNENIELPGKDYAIRLKLNPKGSLARFYNFCFSLASSDYLLKWDAHMILMPFGVKLIQNELQKNPNLIFFTGVEIFGRPLSLESYIRKRSLNLKYVDGEHWERLFFTHEQSRKSSIIKKSIFIHVKALAYSYSKNISDGQFSIYK